MKKFTVGLTGGIGSGKSTVAALFARMGIDVVNADQCSRIVVEKGKPALESIRHHFGETILLPDGTLDRPALRALIFRQAQEKEWLEKLLHPLIHDEILRQLDQASSVYTILESPLLVETAQKTLCHRILVVDVPEEQQIARTVQRDNNNPGLVKAIMASQASRSDRRKAADDIIDNSRDATYLHGQVEKLHGHYLQLAKSPPYC